MWNVLILPMRNIQKNHVEFFDCFAGKVEVFLDSIITGGEIWVYRLIPESKRQAMTWQQPTSNYTQKVRQIILSTKIMATVFWDLKMSF